MLLGSGIPLDYRYTPRRCFALEGCGAVARMSIGSPLTTTFSIGQTHALDTTNRSTPGFTVYVFPTCGLAPPVHAGVYDDKGRELAPPVAKPPSRALAHMVVEVDDNNIITATAFRQAPNTYHGETNTNTLKKFVWLLNILGHAIERYHYKNISDSYLLNKDITGINGLTQTESWYGGMDIPHYLKHLQLPEPRNLPPALTEAEHVRRERYRLSRVSPALRETELRKGDNIHAIVDNVTARTACAFVDNTLGSAV